MKATTATALLLFRNNIVCVSAVLPPLLLQLHVYDVSVNTNMHIDIRLNQVVHAFSLHTAFSSSRHRAGSQVQRKSSFSLLRRPLQL